MVLRWYYVHPEFSVRADITLIINRKLHCKFRMVIDFKNSGAPQKKVKSKVSSETFRVKRTKSHFTVPGSAVPGPDSVSHLSDGSAELTLKDLLQRLELVTGDVTRLLQLLQQLDGPGNIWQRQTERRCVWGC